MSVGIGGGIGIGVGVLALLFLISKAVHGNGERTLVSSDQGGGTRRHRKKGTRRK
jgi:hypothetical protein